MTLVIFACVHNAGRSQMAAAFFNAAADPSAARAQSAGTQPADRVNPVVVEAMREVDIDVSRERPRLLTTELTRGADWLITMGCGDDCPVVAGVKREDWPLEDPADQPLGRVRDVRDAVRAKVDAFIAREGYACRYNPRS
jgi:arsenate reductase (thioredoxin)